MNIWNAIEEGPYEPFTVVNNIREVKPKSSWNDEDKKKMQYDLKAKNILTSTLGIDEFFRVSNCKSAKEMWDTIETTHEGTEEEHELELSKLDQHEEQEKKRKNISLKAKVYNYESSEDEYEKEEMEDMSLLVKKFSKFLKRNKGAKTGQMMKFTKNNDASTSNQNFTCFECGKPGHMKMDCV
ncbi:hypothetical protein Lal_00015291 [Lupinus albus]|nr:hypothetical protein Lal_00015291 [Lupinus albus]